MKARVIALYLPQYHPIPENDEWWGKGFTEWTNVTKAKPQFKGHYQPKIPTELGFYDLRMSEVREAQAELAREAGIEGFCYWHYWFGNGRQLLERPFNEVLDSGQPDFPFCIGWANHTWTSRTWNKTKNINTPEILIKQEYFGYEDYEQHFYTVLPAFTDRRYIRVDDKPFFLIYDPIGFTDVKGFIETWRKLADKNGLPGIHFVGCASAMYRSIETNRYKMYLTSEEDVCSHILNLGFDAVNLNGQTRANVLSQGFIKSSVKLLEQRLFNLSRVNRVSQEDINRFLYSKEDERENIYPTLIPNYDRTPRTNKDTVYINSTPEVFEKSILNCLQYLKCKQDEHKIIILKSWNEWGEGNYVEPDIKYGRGYIDALSRCLKN